MVLEQLMYLLKAEAVLISRFVEGSCKAKPIAVFVSEPAKGATAQRKTFTEVILGENLRISEPGSTWVWSETGYEMEMMDPPRVQEQIHALGLRDIALVALETNSSFCDYLEFQFRADMPEYSRNLLFILARTLAKTWMARLPGTGEKQLAKVRNRKTAAKSGTDVLPILDVDNPVGLSRCEYRICTMVREGMLVKDIGHELAVRGGRVRSHLHSIYTKTGSSGQIELLHRLSTSQKRGAAISTARRTVRNMRYSSGGIAV
ncbi:MAG: helix-turn-helix transcriptional regulator [Halocynthiibacter sp.]